MAYPDTIPVADLAAPVTRTGSASGDGRVIEVVTPVNETLLAEATAAAGAVVEAYRATVDARLDQIAKDNANLALSYALIFGS